MEVGKRRQEKEIGGGRGKRDRPRGVREAEDAKVEKTQEEKKKAENEQTEGNDRRAGARRLELGPWEVTSLFLPSCGSRA